LKVPQCPIEQEIEKMLAQIKVLMEQAKFNLAGQENAWWH
jgi:hypothetical protein